MGKYDENFAIKMAIEASMNSNCQSKRGSVIWDRNYGLISTGFNSPPSPYKCDGSNGCKSNCNKTAIHAEERALINVRDNLRKYNNVEILYIKTSDGKPMYSEKPTCIECSKLILASEIKYVWLLRKEGLTRYTSEEFHKQSLINNGLCNESINEKDMIIFPCEIYSNESKENKNDSKQKIKPIPPTSEIIKEGENPIKRKEKKK